MWTHLAAWVLGQTRAHAELRDAPACLRPSAQVGGTRLSFLVAARVRWRKGAAGAQGAWVGPCQGDQGAAVGLAASYDRRRGDLVAVRARGVAWTCCRGALAGPGASLAAQGVPVAADTTHSV